MYHLQNNVLALVSNNLIPSVTFFSIVRCQGVIILEFVHVQYCVVFPWGERSNSFISEGEEEEEGLAPISLVLMRIISAQCTRTYVARADSIFRLKRKLYVFSALMFSSNFGPRLNFWISCTICNQMEHHLSYRLASY